MNENWQSWLVFLLVVAAAIYSAWYVLPVSVRQRLAVAAPQRLTQSPSLQRLQSMREMWCDGAKTSCGSSICRFKTCPRRSQTLIH
jgi:hypothetical protein